MLITIELYTLFYEPLPCTIPIDQNNRNRCLEIKTRTKEQMRISQ